MKSSIRAGLFVSLCSLTAFNANAASMTLFGDTINYVYEDTQAAIGLLGDPIIIGDTVVFAPENFLARSENGVGINSGGNVDVASANFKFDRVYSTNGTDIAEIKVIEDGDYEIMNGDSASLRLRLTALNLNNAAESTNELVNLDFIGDSGGAQNWMAMAAVNPSADFATDPNNIMITIQNTLTATTNAQGELAWIQKKLTFAATTVIPVPGAVWLFGSALGLLGFVRRRIYSAT